MWSQAIAPLGVALVVWLAVWGVGLAVLSLAARGRSRHTGIEVAVAPALGFGIVGYVADLLFMSGGLDMRPVYWALTGLGLLLFASEVRRWPVRVPSTTAWLDRILWTAGWLIIAWFGWKLFVGNVTPINDNDSIYHYAFFSRLLSSGATFDEILLLRNFPTTDLNRIIQHVYGLAGTLGGDSALHMMNFLFIVAMALLAQGLAAGALRATRWLNPLPVLAVLSLREIIYTGFTAKLDYGVAMLELSAAALFLTWRDRARWLLPVGLALALCARTNSLRFAAIIPALWILDQLWTRQDHGGWSGIARRTMAVGVATILLASPPYAMQQYIYGNPFYPMLNGVFGEYSHYYDWVMFDSLRYVTEYGWLSAPVVYATVALKNLYAVPGVVTPPNSAWGLSALMLLAPFALRLERATIWLLGFVAGGYLTWYWQANTHRSLLSVAVLAVVLGAVAVIRLRARLAPLFVVGALGIAALTVWTGRDQLGLNNLQFNYHYVAGRWSAAEYHDLMVRRIYPGVIPDAAEVAAIKGLVGDHHMASIDLTPFAHGDLIRTRRLMLPTIPMPAMAADEKGDASDRRIARELSGSPYLASQAQALFARLWPADGVQQRLSGGADLRWYLTASHDAWRHVADALLEDPRRLAPLLRFEGVDYVLVLATSVYGTTIVEGLTEVWRSPTFVLLRVETA